MYDLIIYACYSSEPGSPNAPIAIPARPFHFTTTGEKPKPLTPADKSKLLINTVSFCFISSGIQVSVPPLKPLT